MDLYRPISSDEYCALKELQFSRFPPCGSAQPLFTALLSQEGASQIAKKMRLAKQAERTVYVICFRVDDAYIRQFPVKHTQDAGRDALWIPAEEMEILNQHLIGKIQVLDSYELGRTGGDVFFA